MGDRRALPVRSGGYLNKHRSMLAHMRAPATPHVASTTPRIHRAGAQTLTIISVLPRDRVSEPLPPGGTCTRAHSGNTDRR